MDEKSRLIEELGVNCQYPLSGETFEQKKNFREVDLGYVADFILDDRRSIIPLLTKCYEVLHKPSLGGLKNNRNLIKALEHTIKLAENK